MVSDEELFRRAMEDMDVRPGKAGRSRRRRPEDRERAMAELLGEMEDQVREREDRELFLNHLAGLREVPDKEAFLDREAPSGRAIEKRKLRKKQVVATDDTLDLHGLTRDVALHRLAQFIARAFTKNLRAVLVITGKGKHSPGEVGVLRTAVEEWVLYRGGRFVHAYAEAPRMMGGAGAFILYLRKS